MRKIEHGKKFRELKRKGYVAKDMTEIIKIGKRIGMCFNDISQVVKDIEEAEDQDRASFLEKKKNPKNDMEGI